MTATNYLKIITQKNLTTYLVSSITEKVKSKEEKIYVVDLKKSTCTCPWYEHNSANFLVTPCKHYSLCANIVAENKLKNRIHQFLFAKKIRVIKVLKITHVRKQMYSVVYFVKDGGKCCTFVNLDKLPEKGYFDALKSKTEDSSLEFQIFINSDNIAVDRLNFGSQFSIKLTEKGWIRFIPSYAWNQFVSLPLFGLYDAVTSPVLPISDVDKNHYLQVLFNLDHYDGFEDYEPLTWLALKGDIETSEYAQSFKSNLERQIFRENMLKLQTYSKKQSIVQYSK